MGNFARQIATAKRLIAKNGRKCVWRAVETDAPADASKPWLAGGRLDIDHEVTMLFLPHKDGRAFLRSMEQSTLEIGDDYGLMAAVEFTPTMHAEIYDETGTTLLRRVLSLNTLAPDGDPILHTVNLGVS